MIIIDHKSIVWLLAVCEGNEIGCDTIKTQQVIISSVELISKSQEVANLGNPCSKTT